MRPARALPALALLLAAMCPTPGHAATAPARVTADRPGTAGLRVHLVYLVNKGFHDRHYDTDGHLAAAAAQIQAWFRRETGGRQLRLDTYDFHGRVVPDISYVHAAHPTYTCNPLYQPQDGSLPPGVDQECAKGFVSGGDPVDLVAGDLAAAGLKDPQVRYLVLVEGTASIICGQSYEPDETDRDPTHVGHVAAVFLADSGCPDDAPGSGGEVDWELVHEYLHNDGAVPDGAPHGCAPSRDHVCTAGLGNGSPFTDAYDPERADVMYPSPGIGLKDAHLDLGHDDYYDTAVGVRDVADSPYFR